MPSFFSRSESLRERIAAPVGAFSFTASLYWFIPVCVCVWVRARACSVLQCTSTNTKYNSADN